MRQSRAGIGPAFLAKWVAASAAGWVAGVFVAIIVSNLVLNLFYPKETNLLVGACVGATVAAFQYLVVRRRIELSPAWIWGGLVTMASPTILFVVFAELGWSMNDAPVRALLWAVSIAVGAVGVLIQAAALRHQTNRWALWIPASAVIWGVTVASSAMVDMMAGGVVYGVASGALLSLLLRLPPSGGRAVEMVRGEPAGPGVEDSDVPGHGSVAPA